MSNQPEENFDFQNSQTAGEVFFQPVTICSNPLRGFEYSQTSISQKPLLNILQPSHISKNNIINNTINNNNNNQSYSPNRFRDLNMKNATKSSKRCHTENSVNDENCNQQDQGKKENVFHSTNKLSSVVNLSLVENNKVESLNESINKQNDNTEDAQRESLLEKDEEIQMLKAKRAADSIEIQYLKNIIQSVQNETTSLEIIDQGDNFTFYSLPFSMNDNQDIQLFYEDLETESYSIQENMNDNYINSCISRLIERNSEQLITMDLKSDIYRIREERYKDKVVSDKRLLQLEGMIQIEQMFHRSLDTEKKNLISKLADLELKLEHQISQQKKYQELIQKLQQEMNRQQEKLEFREYEINQLNEKKNVYQTKLKDYSEINQEYKRRLEEKDKQLEELKEKISEPIENINMVFSIVSNYKQTLSQFDEKIAELIQKQKVIDKLERQLGDKSEQVVLLVQMGNQMQEKMNHLMNENTRQSIIIEELSLKLSLREIEPQIISEQYQELYDVNQEQYDLQRDDELIVNADEETQIDLKEIEEIQQQEEILKQCYPEVKADGNEEDEEEETVLECTAQSEFQVQLDEKLERTQYSTNEVEVEEEDTIQSNEYEGDFEQNEKTVQLERQSIKKKKTHGNKHSRTSSHKKRKHYKSKQVSEFSNEGDLESE